MGDRVVTDTAAAAGGGPGLGAPVTLLGSGERQKTHKSLIPKMSHHCTQCSSVNVSISKGGNSKHSFRLVCGVEA